jgi:hypothetical protein
MNCEFCNKTFKSISNLNLHKKTAKYCLDSRQNNENKLNIFTCNYCKNNFNRKTHLERHIEICKEKDITTYKKELEQIKDNYEIKINEIKENYESLLAKSEAQIKDLQDRLERICNKAIDKPSNVTNNKEIINNNNIFNNIGSVNLNPDHIEKTFQERMTLEQVYRGQEGVAELCCDYLLTDNEKNTLAYCTDKARQVIKYKNENNIIIKDPKGYNLVNKIYKASEKAALKLKDEFMNKIYNNSNHTPTSVKIEEVLDDSIDIRMNKKTELKLIRLLCKKFNIKMDDKKSKFFIEDNELKNEFFKRLERIKSKTTQQIKLYKPRQEQNDEIIIKILNENPELKEEDYSDYETDYEDILEEEEREYQEEKIKSNIEDLKNEKDENKIMEKADNLKKSIQEYDWTQEKKDFYLDKLIRGICDIQLMRININKFGKMLSLKLPSEN